LEPFEGLRGGFAGAVGLLHLQATRPALPIDFVNPKQPRPPADPNKRRLVAALAAAAVLLLLGVFFSNRLLAARRAEQANLMAQARELDSTLAALEPDAKHIKALGDWDKAALPWLDELYDLAALFPYRVGLKVTHLNAQPLPPTKNAKD